MKTTKERIKAIINELLKARATQPFDISQEEMEWFMGWLDEPETKEQYCPAYMELFKGFFIGLALGLFIATLIF